MDSLIRSHALNNIPKSKYLTKIQAILEGCDVCASKSVNFGKSLEIGLCEKCRITVTAYNRYYETNIPIEYWDLKMDKDFHGYPGLLNKYNDYVSDLKLAYTAGSSICFAGFHGVGKTLASTNILKKACQKGYNCLYSDMSSIVSVLIQSSFEEKYLARKELVMVDFLVIDELDIRFFAASDAANELFASNFENIFRTRRQNKLPTLICTNSPNIIDSFKGLNKQSLGSLFSDKIEMYFVLGEDFRKKKGL